MVNVDVKKEMKMSREDAPSEAHESIFSTDDFRSDISFTTWRETPASRPESFIKSSSILDLRQVDKTICF